MNGRELYSDSGHGPVVIKDYLAASHMHSQLTPLSHGPFQSELNPAHFTCFICAPKPG